MNYEEELFKAQVNMLPKMLQQISDDLSRIDLKIHNRYTENDWRDTQETIKKYLDEAGQMYTKLKLNDTAYPNAEKYEEISSLYEKVHEKMDIGKELTGKEKSNFEKTFMDLLTKYSELIYSFQTASREISGDMEVSADKIGMILLCKNVRIMEDLINKICSNNIDKSIIGGDKHFDSMRYGFEWLFCHNDISKSDSYKRIDIRDRNRYLDYIKYQIMVTGRYVDGAPRSSTDIDLYYMYIENAFDKEEFYIKANKIKTFKEKVTQLIGNFFSVYELLIKYRDALFREEEIRKELGWNAGTEKEIKETISVEIINLSSVAIRVLLDRFVSFVKINDLNFGNSTFNRSWFNYSELSSSNYAGSNFKYARIENAKVKNCDISTCNLSLADGGHTDFSYSNFNYSNLTGINLIDATVNYCEFQNAIFRDANIDSYQEAIRKLWGEDLRKERKVYRLHSIWSSLEDSNEPLKEIINTYKEIEFPDLVKAKEEGKIPWVILKCDFSNISQKITLGIRSLITQYLEKHISAELLLAVRDRLSWENREAEKIRIKDYGKVLHEVADLSNISAKYTQISNADLCHVRMRSASFESADLSGSVMHYANAQYASFIQSNGNKIDCFESNFYSVNFSSAIMNNALFLNCNLNRTNWNRAIIIGSIFADFSKYVELTIHSQTAHELNLQINQYFSFDEVDITNQRVVADRPTYKYTSAISDKITSWQEDCSINEASFIDTLADNVVFIDISADRSSFRKASFKNALFANCKMYLSDFIETDFRYANFILCCMGQTNFRNANITGAKLSNVDFSDSNMSGTLLNLSILNHILFENVDMHKINFSGATISNTAFINCNIAYAILSGTQFKNCIFQKIKFNNLIGIHSATFENCFVDNCIYEDDDIENGKLDAEVFGRNR